VLVKLLNSIRRRQLKQTGLSEIFSEIEEE